MSRWISVAEAFPLDEGHGVTADVLVLFPGGESRYDIANYDHETKNWSLPTQGFEHPDCDPTHWMPLPELPEGA
jgi:hypothetical protein